MTLDLTMASEVQPQKHKGKKEKIDTSDIIKMRRNLCASEDTTKKVKSSSQDICKDISNYLREYVV